MRYALLGAIAIVAGIAAIRLAFGGWDAMTADHARYVYAGMSLLDGRGYVNEGADTYLLRAPAYPVLVGGGFALAGADGAHLVAWTLGLIALILAIVVAGRLGGPVATLATTAAVVTVPWLWEQVVTLGVDLPQAAFFLAAVALLTEPRSGRWALAGALLGMSLLIKETLAPAVLLLPLAWLPASRGGPGWRPWLRLTALFLVAAAVVASWWWLLIWRETGQVFPLNAVEAIVPDEAPLSLSASPAVAVGAAVATASWGYLVARRFRDARVRVILAATLASAPAAVITVMLAQPSRNFTTLVLLTCVVTGVAAADALRTLIPRATPRARSTTLAAVVAIAIAAATFGQVAVAPATPDPLPAAAADAIRGGLRPGQHVVSTFRYRSPLGVELFDEAVAIQLIPVRAVQRATDPSDYLWLGVRRGTLFGVRHDRWRRVLGASGARYLVLAGPHPLSPVELLPALRSRAGGAAGLELLEHLEGPTGTVEVFSNRPGLVGGARLIHLHGQPEALQRWLDMATTAGATDAVTRLVAVEPVVPASAEGLARLADRLGAGACLRHDREGGDAVIVVEPRSGQADCLDRTALPG